MKTKPGTTQQIHELAQRVKRVFNIDVSVCTECCGEVKVFGSIEDQLIIDKLLGHLMEKGALPLPPELLPASRVSLDLS